MQSTSFRSLFLSDLLILPHATDGTAKSDADVQRHSLPSWKCADDAYTADESHLCLLRCLRRLTMAHSAEKPLEARISPNLSNLK